MNTYFVCKALSAIFIKIHSVIFSSNQGSIMFIFYISRNWNILSVLLEYLTDCLTCAKACWNELYIGNYEVFIIKHILYSI